MFAHAFNGANTTIAATKGNGAACSFYVSQRNCFCKQVHSAIELFCNGKIVTGFMITTFIDKKCIGEQGGRVLSLSQKINYKTKQAFIVPNKYTSIL